MTAYDEGFYSALRGVSFALKLPGATAENTLQVVQETMDELKAQGVIPADNMFDDMVDFVESYDDPAEQVKALRKLNEIIDGGNL